MADGAFYLARAGLLDGHACTLHWHSQPAFVEAFPHIELRRSVYVIDRTRFTSAGGIGAFDMMLEIIERPSRRGDWRGGVAEWFVHDRIRATADREQLQLRLRTGIRNDLVLDAAARMEERDGARRDHRADRRASSASRSGSSNAPSAPSSDSARPTTTGGCGWSGRATCSIHSSLSVREIGLACGYASFSAFVRAFRTHLRQDAGRRCGADELAQSHINLRKPAHRGPQRCVACISDRLGRQS